MPKVRFGSRRPGRLSFRSRCAGWKHSYGKRDRGASEARCELADTQVNRACHDNERGDRQQVLFVNLQGNAAREGSHSAASFVKLVAGDDRFDVLARAGEIDVAEKILFGNRSILVAACPALSTAGAGIVFGERKGQWVRLSVPMFKRAP